MNRTRRKQHILRQRGFTRIRVGNNRENASPRGLKIKWFIHGKSDFRVVDDI